MSGTAPGERETRSWRAARARAFLVALAAARAVCETGPARTGSLGIRADAPGPQTTTTIRRRLELEAALHSA